MNLIVIYLIIGLVYTLGIHLTDFQLVEHFKHEKNSLEFYVVFLFLVIIWPYTIYKRNIE